MSICSLRPRTLIPVSVRAQFQLCDDGDAIAFAVAFAFARNDQDNRRQTLGRTRRDVILVTPDWKEDMTRRSLRILVKRRKTNFNRASGIEYECAQHDKI